MSRWIWKHQEWDPVHNCPNTHFSPPAQLTSNWSCLVSARSWRVLVVAIAAPVVT